MNSRTVLLKSVLLLILALALSACRTPGSTRPIVKIGLIAPFEGLYRSIGYEVLYAAQLAVQEWNTSEATGGWGVSLVAVDDGLLPARSQIAAEKLAVDADVVGGIGPFSWNTGQTAGPSIYANGIPWIVVAPTPDTLLATCQPFAFRFYPSVTEMSELAADYMRTVAGHGSVIILSEAAPPRIFKIADQLPADIGVEYRMWNAQDGEERLAHLSSSQPILLDGTAEWTAQAIAALRATGHSGSILAGPDAGNDIVMQRAKDAAEGVLWIGTLPDVASSESHEVFVANYITLAGHPPGSLAILTYDATRALLHAISSSINEVGKPVRLVVAEALGELTLPGITGTIAFDESGATIGLPVQLFMIQQGNVNHPIP